jgi:hypothetical protein
VFERLLAFDRGMSGIVTVSALVIWRGCRLWLECKTVYENRLVLKATC